MATNGKRDTTDLTDMVWTLRNWPLELIQWRESLTQPQDTKTRRHDTITHDHARSRTITLDLWQLRVD
jgi:hypothetical protein